METARIASLVFFTIEIMITFNLEINEGGDIISNRSIIAVKYLKSQFIFDILGMSGLIIPFIVS